MIGLVKTAFSGGVNQYESPIALKDNEWQELKNFSPTPETMPGQRQSMSPAREIEPSWWHWDARTLFGSLGVASAVEAYYEWARYIRPLKFMFVPAFGDIAFIAVTTSAIQVTAAAFPVSTPIIVPAGTMMLVTIPNLITGSGTAPVLRVGLLGTVGNTAPSLFSFLDEVYAFGGQNAGVRVSPATGLSVTWDYYANDFGTGNATFAPAGAAVVRDRVVYYKGANVWWSDRNDPLVIGADAETSRNINVSGEEQGAISAIAEISTSTDGSPLASACAVWTKNRMFLLLGEPGESDATGPDIIGTLQINRLNIEAGCVSQSTVVRTPYGTFWAGLDDVWFMPFGQTPIRVGTKIRPVLQNQPAALAWKLHAEYSNGFYRLAVFSPGQGPNSYSPCRDQWWLDLTHGPPQSAEQAAWYGPQEIMNGYDTPDQAEGHGTYTMARDLRANGDGRCYSLQNYVMRGNSASVFGMTLCTFERVEGRDACAPTGVADRWVAATAISVGDVFRPVSQTLGGFGIAPAFICTTAGTTGGAQPDWFAPSATGTVTDGTVTWTLKYFSNIAGDEAMPAYRQDLARYLNDVEVSIFSKEYDFGDPIVDKLLDGAELGYYAADNMRVTYNSHPDQDERSRELYPARIGSVNTLGSWAGGKPWDSKLLTPSPTQRFHAKTAAFSLQQVPGYVIKTGYNDTILITVDGSLRTVVISGGFYADLSALIEEVTNKANQLAPSGVQLENTWEFDTFNFDRGVVGWRDIAQTATVAVTTTGRLAMIFGFSETLQGTIVSNAADETLFTTGAQSPRYTVCPEFQISTLNLRAAAFGRRAV